MRGTGDLHLLETPLPDLLAEVTGITPEPTGSHVLLAERAGIRSTQRLALGDVGGGIVALTWPAELVPQARYLYFGARGSQLLREARAGGWGVDMRPHLAFRNSPASQRLYMNPMMTADEYVGRWAGPDGRKIGQHDPRTIRSRLWPWLLERGYASETDEHELERFLGRLGRRPAHLRPGLRLLRRWPRDEVELLRAQGRLADEIRTRVDRLLGAVGDPHLPAH